MARKQHTPEEKARLTLETLRGSLFLEPCSCRSNLHKSYATVLIIALQLTEKKHLSHLY